MRVDAAAVDSLDLSVLTGQPGRAATRCTLWRRSKVVVTGAVGQPAVPNTVVEQR